MMTAEMMKMTSQSNGSMCRVKPKAAAIAIAMPNSDKRKMSFQFIKFPREMVNQIRSEFVT